MNEKDIREYSRTLLDAFNDLTGNSINPNLDDFLKIRERSIFELNSFHKNNQKTNRMIENVENINDVNNINNINNINDVNDVKIVNSNINQNQNVDKDVNINVNKIDNFKENKESSLTPTSESASKVENEKQENIKEKQIDISNNKKLTQTPTPTPTPIPTSKVKYKPTLIQNKNQNVDNKQPKVDNTINQESKNVEKNEISNNNVIAGEIEETVELDFGDDGDNFEVSEKKSAFDILKGLKDQWN